MSGLHDDIKPGGGDGFKFCSFWSHTDSLLANSSRAFTLYQLLLGFLKHLIQTGIPKGYSQLVFQRLA